MSFISIPTLAGKAKIAAAIAGGAALNITHMAVGDGNGQPVTPLETQAALVHEVWRGAVTSVTRDPQHNNQVVVVATIPLEAGPFMIRELGLYDGAGTLIAVGSHPQIEKTALAQGSGQTLDLTFIIVVDTAASLTIILDAKPQSDWAEQNTQSAAYIKNKPEIGAFPAHVPPSRIIEARLGLTGGGSLEEDRWFDINWPELQAATGLSRSDLLAIYQAAVGELPATHRKLSLGQLSDWLLGSTSTTAGTLGQRAVYQIPDTYQYVMATDLVARGYNLTLPIDVIATLPTNGILGGGPGGYAFRTGTGFANGSTLKLIGAAGCDIIGWAGGGANGEASGYGNGGNGSDAFLAEYAITVDMLGRIGAGGGGGARAGAPNANWAGNNGVSGGAYGAGIHQTNPALFRAVFTYFYATAYLDQPGNYAGGGAPGGGLGQAGQSAGSGTVGGQPGAAVRGNALITWINTGTRLGAIIQ